MSVIYRISLISIRGRAFQITLGVIQQLRGQKGLRHKMTQGKVRDVLIKS